MQTPDDTRAGNAAAAARYRERNRDRINAQRRDDRKRAAGQPVLAYSHAVNMHLETEPPVRPDPNEPLRLMGPIKAARLIGREDIAQRFLGFRELADNLWEKDPDAFKAWASRHAEILDAKLMNRQPRISF